MSPAGFWRRVGAHAIDALPTFVVVTAIAYYFFGFDQVVGPAIANPHDLQAQAKFLSVRNRVDGAALVVWLIYSALFDASRFQGTPGKRLFGLRVVGIDDGRISVGRAVFRNLAKLVCFVPPVLGFLWVAISKNKRSWHDVLSSTRVVRVT